MMVNGDKLVIKEPISTPDIESVRSELHGKYECKEIEFVYEEHPISEDTPAT